MTPMYRLVITETAESDIAAVLEWFRTQRASAAGGRWFNQLLSRLDTLEQHPDRCPMAAESNRIGQEIRELLFGRRRFKYRILFRIKRSTVEILRVWHCSRDDIPPTDIE